MSSILDLTITQLHDELAAKKLSAKEVTDFYLDQIDQYNKTLNAFITVSDERAQEDATHEITDHVLSGIPASIKDVIVTRGIRSTAASQMLRSYVPPYSASLVETLERSGMIMLGKTNCDEFAMGGSNENSSFGPVLNPWDTTRVSGGSSGGSAAAVAAGLCHYSIGTDTGGSVREPASFCSVVGMKPTYGAVSRYGLMAMGSSLDQAGVLARRVADVRGVLRTIQGADPRDATSVGLASDNDVPLENLNGIRVGVPKEYFAEGLDEQVKDAIQQAIDQLEKLGAEIKEISLPHSAYALAAYYIVMPAEVSANMARFDGIRYGESLKAQKTQKQKNKEIEELEELYRANRAEFLGEEVKRRIMLGTYVLSAGYYDAYYGKAQRVRQLIRGDFELAFEDVDIVVGPVAPIPAFTIGEKMDDPLSMYLADIYTVTVNLAGLPALSVPAGFVPVRQAQGGDIKLPVGLHMIGKWWDDYRLLSIAEVFERATEHYKVKPQIVV